MFPNVSHMCLTMFPICVISCPDWVAIWVCPPFLGFDPSGNGKHEHLWHSRHDFDDVPTKHMYRTTIGLTGWVTLCPEEFPVDCEDIHHLWFFGSWILNQSHSVSPMTKMYSMEIHFWFKLLNFGVHRQNMSLSMLAIKTSEADITGLGQGTGTWQCTDYR